MSFVVDSLIRVNDVSRTPQRLGVFSTCEEACAASRQSIDEFLAREFKPGMAVETLYRRFRDYGAVPFIFGDSEDSANPPGFNPIKYAQERCEEICGEALTQD